MPPFTMSYWCSSRPMWREDPTPYPDLDSAATAARNALVSGRAMAKVEDAYGRVVGEWTATDAVQGAGPEPGPWGSGWAV